MLVFVCCVCCVCCVLRVALRLASCVLRLASCVLRLASCVLRLASCVLRLASCVLRLASCVLRLASCVLTNYHLSQTRSYSEASALSHLSSPSLNLSNKAFPLLIQPLLNKVLFIHSLLLLLSFPFCIFPLFIYVAPLLLCHLASLLLSSSPVNYLYLFYLEFANASQGTISKALKAEQHEQDALHSLYQKTYLSHKQEKKRGGGGGGEREEGVRRKEGF